MNHLCYLCIVFFMLSRLFMAALWSPAWKGLTSWLMFWMFNCVFVTFPCGNLGQVWLLIVSIPDLCHLSYFNTIYGWGSVLRLTDSNLSLFIHLFNYRTGKHFHNDFFLAINSILRAGVLAIKFTRTIYRPYTKQLEKEDSIVKRSFKSNI